MYDGCVRARVCVLGRYLSVIKLSSVTALYSNANLIELCRSGLGEMPAEIRVALVGSSLTPHYFTITIDRFGCRTLRFSS